MCLLSQDGTIFVLSALGLTDKVTREMNRILEQEEAWSPLTQFSHFTDEGTNAPRHL
jgi:hypothetical protein